MKVFNIVFGILSLLVAGVCFADPFGSQLMYGYVVALFMGAMGIVSIITYLKNRKYMKSIGLVAAAGTANLVIGILGVVFMLLNMTVPFFTYSVQEFGAIMVALFMLIEGINCVASAITNRSGSTGIVRVMTGILGVLMIIGFAGALAFPSIIISMFGIFLGVGMAIQGVSRIALAFML